MTKIISILILVSMHIIFAQSQLTNHSSLNVSSFSNTLNSQLPKFDIYIAAGIAAGGRVGFTYLFANNFSAEIAYGYDVRNFISLSDLQRRYSLGLNYHFAESNAVISLLNTYIEQPNSVYEAILISPNFGLVPLRESGLKTFFRIGFYIECIKDFTSGKWKVEDFGPNLDVGVSFNF